MRLDRAFAEVYIMLRQSDRGRRSLLASERTRECDMFGSASFCSMAFAPVVATAATAVTDRLVRVLLRVRPNAFDTFEVGLEIVVQDALDDGKNDNDLVHKLLLAFAFATRAEPGHSDNARASPWNIPTSNPFVVLDPRGPVQDVSYLGLAAAVYFKR